MEENNLVTMDTETPKEKKPRVLKRIKKKKLDLNASSSTKKKKTFSYGRSNISLSTSIQKQSLRANNKALAFNLERSREALRFANDSNLELQRSNQELHMKLTTLERVAGLKDGDIENEVNARLKKHMSELKTKMVGMRRLFYDAFACMDDVMDMCNLLSRHSSGGHRDASLGSSLSETSMSHGTFEGHCRSLFSQIPKMVFSSMLPSKDDLPSESGPSPLSAISHDMSMIAETSVLLDDITPPSDLMEHITDIQESDNESEEPHKTKSLSDSSGDSCVKMAPQRVLKKKSRESPPVNTSKPPSASASAEQVDVQAGSPAVRSKKLDRRGTFVINTSKMSDNMPSKSMFSKEHASDMENEESKPAAKNSQTGKDPSDKGSAAGSDSSSKLNMLSQPSKKPKSPVVSSKTRSRSKGRLDKPGLTVTECADSADVQDRRKTFVVPAVEQVRESCKPGTSKSAECLSVESVGETADDRRKTYLLPPALSNSASNLSLSPVLVGNPEDVTQCFSLDMEMTEVIDNTQLIQLANSEQNQSTEIEATKSSRSESEKEIPKTSKQGSESITLLPNSSDSSDSETLSKPASVEFRIPRPGKIIFSASRKEMDGSRKPVPSKLPLKARTKSKIKLSRSKGRKDTVPESPKELKSIFDFHDRTPKAKEVTTAKTTGSVYDLSMNESLRDNVNKPSLSQFRESCGKEQKEKTSAGSKPADIKLLSDNPVYYEPLKECSPEPPVQKRSRSKSRTRKGDADNEIESRSSRARSRSRRQEAEEKAETDEIVVNDLESRGRSRSKRRQEGEEKAETDEIAVNDLESRGRSRSRRRQDTKEVASPVPANPKESSSSGIEEEAENFKSRGRSRSRRRKDNVESESEVVTERSRSRNRKKDVDNDGKKGSEIDEMNSRTRSRSRRRKEQVEEDVISPKDDLDSDCDGTNSRSRSIKRKRDTNEDTNLLSEKNGLKSRTRSRSRHHKDISEKDIPLEDVDSNSNIYESRSTSGSRQIKDANVKTSESKFEKENEGHTSTARSSDRESPTKEDIVSRKSRGRERSKSRGRVIQDKEDLDIVTRKSRGRSKSQRRKDTVDSQSETDVSSSQTKSKGIDCINVEETPDKELRKMKTADADLIEEERKGAFKRSRSRARSRTKKKEESTGEEGVASKHGTQSKTNASEEQEQPEVVVLHSDEEQINDLPKKKSRSPTAEVDQVPASSDEDKASVSAQKNIANKNLLKSGVKENKDDDVEIDESVIIVSSSPPPPKEKVKAKKKLSLHKKSSSNSSDSLDTNEQSNTTKTKEDAKSVEEKDNSSEKKRRIDASDGDEIPRLAEGLFVTKRGRSLKLSKQTMDTFEDQDLFFDFENLSNNYNVETNKIKLPKTPSTPTVEGSKATPKDKTVSSKLKKLKSAKKSTSKRRRSNCSSVSEAEQQTPGNSNSVNETISSTDKENDRPALGFSEQMQNIRKKLVSLDKQQSKTSIGSQPSAGLSNFDFSKLDMGCSNEPENKRQRRGTAQVSYKEMSLTSKLRREDIEGPKRSKGSMSNTSTPVAKKTYAT
ncbi:microtubule-associated protein futsch-like [Mizuhopecten yessoensis]|uniref:Shugoshin C-terminal domain-containing protein n=1 Tax=Mizuhopecten yessoensis TaxID=6573 RepID=A0A210PHI2_MIZYE|nr:microtubule-associated protein futsch-like [Mizuhopecten yessoensis]OWF35958.1 hypothetical protein KP79_PYT23570 [Mizuhopecten yessoensis]